MNELNKHQQNLIDQLFEGRLPKSEQEAFNKEMESENFKNAVGVRRDIRQMLAEESATDPLKKRMQGIEKKIRVVKMRRWIAVAAGVAVLIIAGWFGRDLILGPGSSTPIALEFLDLPPEHSIAGESPEQLLLSGKDAFFRGKDYEKAGNTFAQIEASSKHYSEAQYLLAHSLMQQQKFAGAVPLFNSFISDEDKFQLLPSRYRNQDKIRFERMLAYLGAEQNNAFRPELDYFLQHSDPYYHTKAQALASRLEE